MSARSRIGCALVFAAVSLGALGACGADAKSVAAPDVASQIKQQLTMAGRPVDSVTCANDLAAEVGATETCTVVGGGTTYGAQATVTTVDQGTANFDIKIVDAPPPPTGG
jgi:hypothetical protein